MLRGFEKSCDIEDVAGVVKLGLISAKSFIDATLDTTDEDAIKTIILTSEDHFVKYQFKEDECEFQENGKGEGGPITFEQKIVFKLGVMSSKSRAATQEIAKASGCGLVAVVYRPNGEIQIVGWDKKLKGERPLRLQATTGTTGKKFEDATGEEITLGRTTIIKAHYYVGDGDALFASAVPKE